MVGVQHRRWQHRMSKAVVRKIFKYNAPEIRKCFEDSFESPHFFVDINVYIW